MSNITVTQMSGPLRAQVLCSERITPNMQRVTFTGKDLTRLQWRGFDQWVRIFFPAEHPNSLSHVPERLTRATYLRMLALPSNRRPIIRSYTLRNWRPEIHELDIDFVVHGERGVAGPWAMRAKPGEEVALLDQGCGWPEPAVNSVFLAADETGLPAVAGILRDLPRDATGTALIELPDIADVQIVDAPVGVNVHWLKRPEGYLPGQTVLESLPTIKLAKASRHAFAVGEAHLATGVRRAIVRENQWDKAEVTFAGYWKM